MSSLSASSKHLTHEIAVSVRNVGLTYTTAIDSRPTLKARVKALGRGSKQTRVVRALDEVNLDVEYGQVLGVIGTNGAGKSSLMRTIAALQSADSGSIVFDGIDVLADPQALRKTLGYLPQDFNVYPRISAFDLLDHLAVLKGLTEKKSRHETVNALLAHTNLFQHKDKAVSSFSGGMRQRFGI